MIRSFLAALLTILIVLAPPQARSQILAPILFGKTPVAAPYSGPGDITAFTAWVGLDCYDNAKATGSTQVANIRAASGPNSGSTYNAVCLSTGYFDLATARTFAGTDATCTASAISATTLTVGTCTGNLTVGDEISGTGVTVGTFITTSGCTTTPGSTCSVSISQTAASESITAAGALFVTELYDQTGNNACASSNPCNVSQSTSGDQPLLLLACEGWSGSPCLITPSASTSYILTSANSFTPNSANIVSYSVVYNQLTATSGNLLWNNGTSGNQIYLSTSAGHGGLNLAGGASGTITVSGLTEAAFHAAEGVMESGSGVSVLNVDGAETTGTITPNHVAGDPTVMKGSAGGIYELFEVGWKDDTLWSQTVRTNLCANQLARGVPISAGTYC